VIGNDAVEARLGGYSGPGNQKISILEGIREKLGDAVKVNYAEGCGIRSTEWKIIASEQLSTVVNGKTVKGLSAEYFSNLTFAGKPAFIRTDQQINFNWTLFSPDPLLQADHYAIRWNGNFKATATGKFKIGLEGNDGYRLYINDTLVIDQWNKQSYHTKLVDRNFVKDTEYKIRVEFYETNGNAHIHLVSDMDVQQNWKQQIEDVVNVSKNADATIVTVGIQEGEFQDRAMLNLPGHQEELIQKLAATGKSVVVVLVAGSAVTMNNWLDKVDGLLEVWYPGEEGGRAVADVLFGDHNPAGRLPITFPISEAQLPLVYNHKPTGRGDDYNNLTGLPLFPFGFGLSYTHFDYSNIHLDKKQIKSNESVIVHATITNSGDREGDEVVQLYIRDMIASVARPVLELKGFQRIHLKAGESKDIAFKITPTMLQMLNEQMKTVVEPGEFRIMIGSSSRELWLKEILTVN
jgi:beta-glucosidase